MPTIIDKKQVKKEDIVISPAGEFMFAMAGTAVINKTSGRYMPKYVLWHIHRNNPMDLHAIVEKSHHQYLFIPKKRNPNGGYTTTLQV